MFTNAQDAREYMTAGNATVTFESEASGVHFTYRVRQCPADKGNPVRRWFVSLLNGPNNEADYVYIGLLDQRSGDIEFRQTSKSRVGANAPSVLGFVYAWRHLYADKMPPKLLIRHEGSCGRCGRKLTVPESLDRGIGPECSNIMAKAA